MQPDLIIPDECVPYIRFQRSRLIKVKVPDDAEVKRRYAEWVAEDFAGMEPHLPERVDSILEIGCGMAAIQVLFKRKYPHARLELLDGDTVTKEGGGGYSDKPDVYNSRALTELLLGANGVTVDRWRDIGTKELLAADLIISMASAGYHYPVRMYRLNGMCIMDLRRKAEKQRGKVIFVGIKYDRCAFQINDA
ncbi:MAG: hypothetical protein ACTS6J_01975 [Burkholderiales bacterium]